MYQSRRDDTHTINGTHRICWDLYTAEGYVAQGFYVGVVLQIITLRSWTLR